MEQMMAWWLERESRERWVLGVGAALLLLVLISEGIVSPLAERHHRAERALQAAQEAQGKMAGLVAEYRALQARNPQGAGAAQSGSPLSRVEAAGRNVGIGDRISRIKPIKIGDSERVSVQVEQIAFKDAIRFMAAIESGGSGDRIERMSIKERYREPGMCDLRLEVGG